MVQLSRMGGRLEEVEFNYFIGVIHDTNPNRGVDFKLHQRFVCTCSPSSKAT